MTDTEKTREQLIEEVATLRARVAELEGCLPKDFVVNLARELRTPITSIKLYEHLIREHVDNDPEKRERYHTSLRFNLHWLERTIEKSLYWIHLQTGWEPQLRLEAVDLNSMIDSNITSIQTLAEGREVSLTFAAQSDLPPAQSSGLFLGSYVLHSILDNAVMYTPKGGEVTVTTGTQDTRGQKWVGVTVSDTGPGIPPEEMPHVFEPYFRGEAGHRSIPSTGLGLAIAKQTVDLLQGQIEIASSGIPGEGTTVSVWLPVAED